MKILTVADRISDLTNPNRQGVEQTANYDLRIQGNEGSLESMAVDKMKELKEAARSQGIIHYSSTGLASRIKRYLDEMKGIVRLNDNMGLTSNSNSGAEQKSASGYPTQKPLALVKIVIIKASSESRMTLYFDPFCGCATALCRGRRNWCANGLE